MWSDTMKNNLVLASASPRRSMLLKQIGLNFQVRPSVCEEIITRTKPDEVVKELAEQKALDVADSIEGDAIIIGADTVVANDGILLGKPKDIADAKRMLTNLSGKTHQVYTGVCVLVSRGDELIKHVFADVTDVRMYDLTQKEILWYIESEEPMDKAGAYGIQGLGSVLVKEIHGDYNTVVGMPLARLYRTLKPYLSEAG